MQGNQKKNTKIKIPRSTNTIEDAKIYKPIDIKMRTLTKPVQKNKNLGTQQSDSNAKIPPDDGEAIEGELIVH